MLSEPRRYIFSGGGTSGHINPALAIASEVRRRDPSCDILFLGAEDGLELELVARAGYTIESTTAEPLPDRFNAEAFRRLWRIRRAIGEAKKTIRRVRPHAVVGTGGYVCSPLIFAAQRLGIPSLLHEQNAFPGRSNRLLGKRCDAVCLTFSDSAAYFSRGTNTVLTAIPCVMISLQRRVKLRASAWVFRLMLYLLSLWEGVLVPRL